MKNKIEISPFPAPGISEIYSFRESSTGKRWHVTMINKRPDAWVQRVAGVTRAPFAVKVTTMRSLSGCRSYSLLPSAFPSKGWILKPWLARKMVAKLSIRVEGNYKSQGSGLKPRHQDGKATVESEWLKGIVMRHEEGWSMRHFRKMSRDEKRNRGVWEQVYRPGRAAGLAWCGWKTWASSPQCKLVLNSFYVFCKL